jgi:uncharacterized membrane protein YccC
MAKVEIRCRKWVTLHSLLSLLYGTVLSFSVVLMTYSKPHPCVVNRSETFTIVMLFAVMLVLILVLILLLKLTP